MNGMNGMNGRMDEWMEWNEWMSHAMRLHSVPSVRMYCKGYGAVRGASVSSCVLLCCFVAGALRRSHTEGRQPPNPKGWTSRSRRHQPLGPTSWAPVQRESRTVRPISLAFLEVQQTVGSSIHPRQLLWIATRQHLWAIDD